MSPRLASWTELWWWTMQAIRSTPFVTATPPDDAFCDRVGRLRAIARKPFRAVNVYRGRWTCRRCLGGCGWAWPGEGSDVGSDEAYLGAVNAFEVDMRARTDGVLSALTDVFRKRLGDGESLDDLLAEG
jgi:hypothetical protein